MRPVEQDGTLRMPQAGDLSLSDKDCKLLLDGLVQALSGLSPTPEWIDPLLSVLERYTANLPAVGRAEEISLFDQVKLTAAVAGCISEVLLEIGPSDHSDLMTKKDSVFDREVFLLYSADFSGIQKFIYTVGIRGALRMLRSRSFFLEIVMEHYLDELLRACGMSRANLLYSGGGHCYLLLPNTARVRDVVERWNTKFNEWLFSQFGPRLFLAQ